MVKRKIVWSIQAKDSLKEILRFYTVRNGNTTYSKNLFLQINQIIGLIQNNNLIGKMTDEENTRVFFKGNFAIFYEIKESVVEIQLIWDNRRNPGDLSIQTS